MIGQISGLLLEKQPPHVLVEVNGVGYEIDAPMSTFYRLPDVGQAILLYTHFVVREDAHLLYGFFTREERTLFRTLIKVNGVGPKLGLTILSSIQPQEFARCVVNQDAAALVSVPGIGKKTAERLMIEMRDKLCDWEPVDQGVSTKRSDEQKSPGRQLIRQDAISALISLGYKSAEASRVVAKVDDGHVSSEDIIRLSLRERMA